MTVRTGVRRLSGDDCLRGIAVGAWLLVSVTVILGLAIWMARGAPRLPVSYVSGPMGTSSVVLCGLVFSTAGAYLMARAPRNVIGWVFMAIGLGMAIVLPINVALADVIWQYRPVDTPVVWLAWAVTSVQVPASGTALVVVLLLFPAGRPEWRHGRRVMALAIAGGALVTAGAALRPDGLLWYPALPNPIPVPAGLRDALAATVGLGTVLLVLALVVASGWLARRARQAQGSQRRQLAWIVAGGLIMSVTLAPLFLARYVVGVDDALGERIVFTAALGAVVFPLTVSIAVQREDLFGIRDLLGRSLVYVPLMALLAGLYSASVMLFQKLFVAFTGASSDAAVVLATLLVASSLAPARSLLESIVKRTTQASEAAGAERPAHGLTGAEDEDELDGRLARLEARLAHLERSPRSRRTWDRERSPAAHRRGASRSRERRSSSPVP